MANSDFHKAANSFHRWPRVRLSRSLTFSDMDRFYASWPDGKRAKARKLHKLKGFVQFCLKRKWLTEDIASDLEPPEGHSIPANKSLVTDEEIDRIIAACHKIGGPVAPGPGHREWTGEKVKDFIYVMLYTGMRITVLKDASSRTDHPPRMP